MLSQIIRTSRVLLYLCSLIVLLYLGHLGYLALVTHLDGNIVKRSDVRAYLHREDNEQPATTFKAGEAMFLHLDSDRTSACNVAVTYRIIKETHVGDSYHRTVYYTFGTTTASLHSGHYAIDIRIELPVWLKPGDYLIDRAAIYTCSGMSFDRSPQIPLTIER